MVNEKQIHKLIHSLDALALPAEINQVWSMDFMSDSFKDGRSIGTSNVIDDGNRESLAMAFWHLIARPKDYTIAATKH